MYGFSPQLCAVIRCCSWGLPTKCNLATGYCSLAIWPMSQPNWSRVAVSSNTSKKLFLFWGWFLLKYILIFNHPFIEDHNSARYEDCVFGKVCAHDVTYQDSDSRALVQILTEGTAFVYFGYFPTVTFNPDQYFII